MNALINNSKPTPNNCKNGDKAESKVYLVHANREFVDDLLANNAGNRPLNRSRVKALADDMRTGRWKFNGDTIVIDSKLRLIDGQHRLAAIREAGYPKLDLLVVQLTTAGEDSNAIFRTIDSGKPRTMSDTFAIEGHKYAPNIAAICRTIVMVVKGAACVPTKGEMHTVYELMQREIDTFAAYAQRKGGIVKYQAASVAAFAIIAYLSGNIPSVTAFADSVQNGINLAQTSPEYRLLVYLKQRYGRHVSSQYQIDVFCATCRATIRHLFAEANAKPFTTCKGDNRKTITNLVRWANGINKPIFAAIYSSAA